MNKLREFVAHVVLPKKGGTQAVTVKAHSREEAIEKLMKMGYEAVNGING